MQHNTMNTYKCVEPSNSLKAKSYTGAHYKNTVTEYWQKHDFLCTNYRLFTGWPKKFGTVCVERLNFVKYYPIFKILDYC